MKIFHFLLCMMVCVFTIRWKKFFSVLSGISIFLKFVKMTFTFNVCPYFWKSVFLFGWIRVYLPNDYINVYILLSLFTFKNLWKYKITYAYNMLIVVWVKSNRQDFSSIQNRHLYYHNVNGFKVLNWVVSIELAKRF